MVTTLSMYSVANIQVDPLVIIAVVAIIQTHAATNPHVLSIDRRIRIVCSIFFIILAFSPIPVVVLVLVLLRFGSTTTEVAAVTTAADKEKGLKQKKMQWISCGGTTVVENRVRENGGIVENAALLTIEQEFRAAQVHCLPHPGASLPWYISKAAFWVPIFGIESIVICFLGLAELPKWFTHLSVPRLSNLYTWSDESMTSIRQTIANAQKRYYRIE
ncbi:hypothetical protein FRB91_002725 [Serendipita sp. 411]|nr:hypothetical protein FRB91_002725 [Serendipita sp. 411]